MDWEIRQQENGACKQKQQNPSCSPAGRRQLAALPGPAVLDQSKSRHDLANRQHPLRALGSACPSQHCSSQHPGAQRRREGWAGLRGSPSPEDATNLIPAQRAALPPSDTAGPCRVEKRDEGGQTAGDTAPVLSTYGWGCCPTVGAECGTPPAQQAGLRVCREHIAVLPPACLCHPGLGKWERADAVRCDCRYTGRSSLPNTGRAGEEGEPQPQAGTVPAASCFGAWGYWKPSAQGLESVCARAAGPGHPAASPGPPRAAPSGTWHPRGWAGPHAQPQHRGGQSAAPLGVVSRARCPPASPTPAGLPCDPQPPNPTASPCPAPPRPHTSPPCPPPDPRPFSTHPRRPPPLRPPRTPHPRTPRARTTPQPHPSLSRISPSSVPGRTPLTIRPLRTGSSLPLPCMPGTARPGPPGYPPPRSIAARPGPPGTPGPAGTAAFGCHRKCRHGNRDRSRGERSRPPSLRRRR